MLYSFDFSNWIFVVGELFIIFEILPFFLPLMNSWWINPSSILRDMLTLSVPNLSQLYWKFSKHVKISSLVPIISYEFVDLLAWIEVWER
ncbi:hypothetical protein WICPIJ_005670 [Wickerhamomyces pijperi]|uniref:Uncharacterized protein n=1 Tax=Wickerhamomyces pijperi TaxID=599730 RepID=A0A9P8Q3K9_WICPI|nr:hypothetical protein WICPIJ_005670 [Wickerhamomyces pijperi]